MDWNAVQNANGISYLPNGLVNTTGPGVAELATPIWLNVGDTITFMIYDVTSTAAGLTNLTFSYTSIMADSGVTSTTPFSGSTGTPTATSGQMYSTYFEGIYPAWGTGTLTILNNGGYLLTFTVTATVGSTTRSFVDDPEMVVGDAPGSKSPGKPSLQRRPQLFLGDLLGVAVARGGAPRRPFGGWGGGRGAGGRRSLPPAQEAFEVRGDRGFGIAGMAGDSAGLDGEVAGGVAQLAHVAGPGGGGEAGGQRRGEPGLAVRAGVRQAVLFADRRELQAQEMEQQAADVVAPVAQGGEPQLVTAQAVEKWGAEASGRDLPLSRARSSSGWISWEPRRARRGTGCRRGRGGSSLAAPGRRR